LNIFATKTKKLLNQVCDVRRFVALTAVSLSYFKYTLQCHCLHRSWFESTEQCRARQQFAEWRHQLWMWSWGYLSLRCKLPTSCL